MLQLPSIIDITMNKPSNPTIASSKILFLRKKLYLNVKYSNVLHCSSKDLWLVFRIWYLVHSSEVTLNWQKVCIHDLLVE